MRSVLLLTALVASALAGPTGLRQTCALHCTEANTFSYDTGKSYVYQYSVTTSTALLGTFDDDARMHITANAHVDVTAPCEYTLRLTEVTLEGSSHAEEFAAAITKSPLRFSFQDGRVESICGEVSEPAWVLNIKRGVLSTFQNSMTRQVKEDVHETDISGVCVTHYKSLMEGNVMTVEKVKDLSSCTERPELAAYIASKPYDTDSPVQSLPIFKSTHKCNQRIEEGVLRTAECEEIHKYRPFSSDEGGAVTTVKTTMSLVSMDGPAIPVTADYQFISKSLVFEQTATSKPEAQVEEVEKILNDLETAANDEIRPEVPVLFSTLVASLKDLDYPTLSAVYTNTRHRHSRKFLLDAMPLVGTAASVGVVKDMFLNGDMTKADGNIWFTSLAFLKSPTSDMFTAIAPLLENNPSQEAMLGISSMVNTYCKIKPDCTADQGVRQVLRRIETQLGYDCRAVNEEEKMKVLVALKALGNAGHWINANGILRQCYTEDNAIEVRVAAIEAWRHTPCEYDRSNLLAAFQDETQDSEVRIAAYLAVMTCPTQTIINTIKDRLTSEGVNQVGSFIWTHLTNMQESAAPGKQWAREMIGEELLQKKFSTEALKFSRNYESSFFMNELNAGAAVESNVIFSSKSFLPRSAMLNLTLDLFGESINLFEIGGRIEGFEAYVERFFGPNGYFPEETIEGIIRNMRQAKPDAEATTLEGILDNVTNEPEGSYYLRVFGNELHYNHFHGLEELMKSTGASNPLDVLMDLAREGEVDYTKSHQLIDTHYSIPTASGLPLTLTAQGTATLALRMNGTFEAENLKNINIEGRFHPSAAVQLDGLMFVDAHITRTGLKISSTLHTSTFLDGRVKIQGGKLADIAFNTPRDKIEVIDVKTKFFYLEGDKEVQQEPEAMVEYEGCTSGFSGIAMCGELSYTPSSPRSPIFPLSGPAAAHVYFKKTDTHSAYILRFTREENGIALLMDTPESQVDQRIFLAFMKAEQEIHFDLRTPFRSLQGNVEYDWRKNDKRITFDLTIDESDRYKVDAGIKTSGNRVMIIEPHLFLTGPRGEVLNVVGTLQANARDAKYGADITISKVTRSPIVLRASYDREENSASVNAMLETPIFEINGNGQLGFEENFVTTKAEVEYSTIGGEKHMIKHSGTIRKDVTENAVSYLVNFELNPTQFADRALAINLRNLISTGHVESKCIMTHGPVTWNLEGLWSYNNRDNHRDFNLRLAVDCPYHGIDFLISKEFKIGRNYLTGESQVRLAPGKDYSLKAELSGRKDREIIGRLETQIPDAKATVEVHLNQIARGHHTVQVASNVLIRGEEKSWILEGTLKNNSVPGVFSVNTEGSFKSQTNEITFSSDVYGDEEKAKINFRSNVNNRKMMVVVEGTRTSITVDANIYRHILVNSYVQNDGETHSVVVSAEWDKDVDPTKSFMMNGQLSSTGVQALLKYGEETKMSVSGKILDNGVEMEAMWAPNKRVLARVHYSLDDTKSLAATVETPFPGWEKQDAIFTVSTKDYEITSRTAVTWKNTEQMSLIINSKLQPGVLNNAMKTEISFSSNFESFERVTFILDHTMAETTINTNINGLWNDKEMKGNFQVTPSENGVDASATFISPFTEEILVTLHHEFVDTALSTSLEAKYGAEVSTFTLMGQIETGKVQTSTLELKIITPTTIVPEIDGNIKYTYDGTHLALVTEGKVGEKKVMLNVNGEKTITEDSTAITGDLRFITPFTSPVTITLAHTYDGQMFTSHFEMTRIWSTSGTVKMHAKGHMISTNDIVFIANISSPVTNASFSFSHKIANNKISSSVDATLNDERFSVIINGDIDTPNGVTSLKGEVTSTYSGMDDINLKIESKKGGNTRTSKAILVKGTKSVNIDHFLSYHNLLNWENSLNVNGKYKLRNKLTHTGTPFVYEMEYTRERETFYVKGTTDLTISEESHKIDAQVIVTTPWEYCENIKIDFHHEDDGVQYNPIIRIEYLSERIFEFATLIKFVAPSFYIESNLTTPFWQPLGYKLNIDLQTRKAGALTLIHGPNETKVNISGNCDQGKLEGYLEIHSSYIRVPVSVETSFDITLPEKKFYLSVSLDKKYEITGSFSGHLKNAKWFLATDLPTEAANHIEFSGEYNTTDFPFIVSTALKLNSNIYEVTGKIDPTEFLINMNINGKKGSLSGHWVFNRTHANIQAHFQSPVNESDDMTAYVMYDFENNKANVKFIRGTQHMNLTGMLQGDTFVFEGTTPFSGWENLSASFFVSKSAISASVSRNNNKIELDGTMDIKRSDGKIGLTITTPYVNYETVSLETIYSFQDNFKTIESKFTFGREELSFKGALRLTDPFSPEIILDVITPFEVAKTVGGKAKWNVKDAVRSAEIQVYHNDLRFNWQLEAAAESPLKGYASCKITSTLRGWTAVSVKGNFDFSAMPYNAVFLYDREGVLKKLEGNLSITENAITADLITPIAKWEKLNLKGTYNFKNNHLIGNLEFNQESEKYDVSCDILFHAETPKLHVEIKTPLTFAANIELTADANVAYTEKAFRITFIKNDITYSAEFKGQLIDKTGFFKVQTRSSTLEYPVLEIYAKYDFTSRVKTIDMNLKVENIHFSVASKVEESTVEINITTPFAGYEDLRMTGDYRTDGQQHSVTASFLKGGHNYNFHVEGALGNNSFMFKLSTPFAPTQNITFMGEYHLNSQGVKGLIHFERNREVFKSKILGNFTPLKSSLTVAINTPVDGLNKLIFQIMYDFISATKSAHISVQKDEFVKTISMKGNYSLDNGSFQIETPIGGFEVLGAKYNLSVDKINRRLDANVEITQNSEEWIFSAYGQYGEDNIMISFQTPFEEFDTITVKGSFDSDAMYVKSLIQFGSRMFSVHVSYNADNMFLEMGTPFEDFKDVYVSAAFKWNARQRDGTLTFVHNENRYMINGVLTVSPRTSGITFQATTPIQNYRNVSMLIKYDLDNRDELIAAQLTVGEHSYHFITGGYIEENRAKFNWDLVSPFYGWTNVKFAASVDFTQENKVLEISLAKDENVKAIAISGKLVGSTVGFNFKSPIPGLHNLDVNASLNRARRSLAVQMTSDVAEASLLTSFQSVSLHLKTPFERAEEISWNIAKSGNDSYTGEFRRNDNFFKFSVERSGVKPSFTVEVKSELQGWEYLALSGMLDQDSLEAYASGAINEDKISISLTGTHSYRSKFTFEITTPYDGYGTVSGEITYKLKKKSIKINAHSSDSDFRFEFKFEKNAGLRSRLVVPNPVEDTELNVNITPMRGSVTFTSRFDAMRSYHQEYATEIDVEMSQIKTTHKITVNGQTLFTLEVEGDRITQTLHTMIHVYGPDFHGTFHLHREGFTKINVALTLEQTIHGVTSTKEYKFDLTGTDGLPTYGTADIVITNSFIQPPITRRMHIAIERRRERKTINVQVVPRQDTVYAIDIEYSINPEEPKIGDFNIRITDPNQMTSSISSRWNVENLEAADLSLTIDGKTYNARGKLGIYESTIVLTSEGNEESIFLEWRVMNDGENIDYFLKIGPQSTYAMFKLKGNITDISHVDIEGGFKAGPFQQNEFLFQSKWDIEGDGSFTHSGSFKCGHYRGTHSLEEHHRNAAKAATFTWKATSNIPDYEDISVAGNYDVNNKLVFAAQITANNIESTINVNLADLQPLHSLNTVRFHIPILNEFADFQLTLAHDFSNVADKYISAVAKMGESESHAKVNWDQTEPRDKFEGTIDIKSIFIGDIFIQAKYDVRDINKAYAEANYSRTDTDETLNIKWTKMKSPSHFENEIAIKSNIEGVPNARAFSTVSFSEGFELTFVLEWGDQKVTTFLTIGESSVSCKITTPFEGFESTEGNVEYSEKGNAKSLNVNYKRGSRNFTVAANLKEMERDKLKIRIKIITPFDEIKKMVIKGTWESNTFTGTIKRNDDEGEVYSIKSDIDFQKGKTGFDVYLKTPENKGIRIAALYDVEDFLQGTGTDVQKVASLLLELPTNSMKFNMYGLRNSDRVYIEIDGEIALDTLQEIHLKLNSERNAEVRHGIFELTLNDFSFRIKNSFERYEDNGYYFKNEVESTITPLPALVFGLGHKGEEHIMTVGYGKEKELTFSVKGKENFKSGFSGFVDIPHYGYKGVKYDVDYRFEGDDELQINLVVALDEDGNKVEANFVYDSEGVKARLNSSFIGDHSMRVRRSLSSDGFFTEAGIDDYNLKLRGQFRDEDITRGAILEGDIFGKKFLFDFLLQSEGLRYSEGKLIIETPFWGMEKMGGLFTWSNEQNKVIAHAEVLLPFFETPKLTGEINIDMNRKFGYMKIDVAGQLFTLKGNLTGVSLSQGYQGQVELHTPFDHLSSVVITANFRMVALSFLQADLKIVEPYNTHVMQLQYELRPEMLTATLSLHARGSYGGIKSTFTLEGLGTTNKKMELTINNDRLTLEYILGESSFKFMLDSLIMNVHRQFYAEANYPSLENLEASLAVVNLAGQTHRMNGKLIVVSNRVQGRMELNSTLLERTPKFNFDISVPNGTDEYVAINMALTAYETHSIYFKLNTRTRMNFTAKIDTPVFPKITVTSELTTTSFRFMIETPTGTHAAQATWRGTLEGTIDCMTNVELMSPLLNDKYIFSVVLNGNTEKTMAKVQLSAGGVIHALEARTSMTTNQGSFDLSIDTPFLNINKATLEASLEFRDKVQVQLLGRRAEEINKFNLVFDKESQTFLTVVESPFIPTGKAVAEAALTGNVKRNMKLQMTLRNAEKAISGILNAKVSSPEAIQIRLRVATPFTGYKKMYFQAQYTRDDVTSIILNLDKPFNFKVNVNFSNMHDALQAKFSMATPFEDFKNIEVELDIPLYKFAPKAFLTLPSHKYGFTADFKRDVFSQMSVYLYLDDASYGGNLGLRTRAPYELACSYHLADMMESKFHLRTDSSFLSAFV